MEFYPTDELSLVGVGYPGVPHQERIIMRPAIPINLGEYFVGLGYVEDDNTITPLPDNLFYFGHHIVAPPAWVLLYTGPGRDVESVMKGTKEPVRVFHWEKKHTIFNEPQIVPMLWKLDRLSIAGPIRKSEQPAQEKLALQG